MKNIKSFKKFEEVDFGFQHAFEPLSMVDMSPTAKRWFNNFTRAQKDIILGSLDRLYLNRIENIASAFAQLPQKETDLYFMKSARYRSIDEILDSAKTFVGLYGRQFAVQNEDVNFGFDMAFDKKNISDFSPVAKKWYNKLLRYHKDQIIESLDQLMLNRIERIADEFSKFTKRNDYMFFMKTKQFRNINELLDAAERYIEMEDKERGYFFGVPRD